MSWALTGTMTTAIAVVDNLVPNTCRPLIRVPKVCSTGWFHLGHLRRERKPVRVTRIHHVLARDQTGSDAAGSRFDVYRVKRSTMPMRPLRNIGGVARQIGFAEFLILISVAAHVGGLPNAPSPGCSAHRGLTMRRMASTISTYRCGLRHQARGPVEVTPRLLP